ncbi:MAG: HU family DNA-binding protein [Betaproteobacteria bacterium]|jgi:DNA-binding protein HU-beta|nr:HU family DNA-binding protein [Betaproteobacteria bacterium]
MNKTELIDAIAARAGVTKAMAGKVLDATTAAIMATLKNEEDVTLVGFGTFYVGERAARTGRNPRTGKAIKIAAAKTPRFRAGKGLKEAVQ